MGIWQLEDSNQTFVRISHFEHKYDLVRTGGTCSRRITIVGHDGSLHHFSVQLPAARHCRREERMMQLFRMLNG
jgi:transformation/transcription domain-associated protein